MNEAKAAEVGKKDEGRPIPASALSPFRHSAFALLWTAATLSHTGTWMHEVGAGWLMAELTNDPFIVALVRTATSVPVFLFALFAGTLADRMDKRRYLMIANSLLAAVAVTMAVLAGVGAMTPVLLLLFTFLLGSGIAFTAPAMQSIMPHLVPKEKLAPALALNSISINLSRVIGPFFAGVLIVAFGVEAAFLANGASFLVVVLTMLLWRAETLPAPKPNNGSILMGFKEGLTHTVENVALKMTMIRSMGFLLFASAFWALMPVVARQMGGEGSVLLGNLVSAVGLGALSGAVLLPTARRLLSINRIAQVGAGFMALSLIGLGLADQITHLMVVTYIGGVGWIGVMTSMHLSAQTALPDWVRARGMAIFIMVFAGGQAVGSALWGGVAAEIGLSDTYLVAGALLALSQILLMKARLGLAYDPVPANP